MNTSENNANKDDSCFDFYVEVMKRLKALDNSKGYRSIRFPEVKRELGMYFHLTKSQTFGVLKKLEEDGKIKIIPFNGIKIIDDGDEG